jgi:hypothetical protein
MNEIYGALVKAQAAAGAVAKDSKNQFMRFNYASADHIVWEARTALSSAGLALVTLGWTLVPSPEKDAMVVGHVDVSYRLVHGSGEHLDFAAATPVLVEKGRPLDKALAGAITSNLGYFLRGLLLLPRLEEAEIEARDDRAYDPHAPQPAPQRTVPRPAAQDGPPTPEPESPVLAFTREFQAATTPAALQAVGKRVASAGLGKEDRDELLKRFAQRMATVKAVSKRELPEAERGDAWEGEEDSL